MGSHPEQRAFFHFTSQLVNFRRGQPVLQRRKYFQGRHIRGADVKDVSWLEPSGREMTDVARNVPFVRALGMLLAGCALDEVDERGRHVVGDTLLILLNAHHDTIPFRLPKFNGGGKIRLRVIDTMCAIVEPLRYAFGTGYSLVGRSMAVFRLVDEARRRAGEQ